MHRHYVSLGDHVSIGSQESARSNWSAWDDVELVRASQNGDSQAFAQLWERHARVAVYSVRSLAHADAEDVVAEAFTCIWDRLQTSNTAPTNFRAYLMAVARNLAAKNHHTRSRVINNLEPDAAALDEPTPANDEIVVMRSEHRQILSAFTELPERTQELMWLAYVEQAPRTEIAQRFALSTNAVSAALRRAKEKLRVQWLTQHLRFPTVAPHARLVSLLPEYVRGGLPASKHREVTLHLGSCPECSSQLEALQVEDQRLSRKHGVLPLLTGCFAAGVGLGVARAIHTRLQPEPESIEAATQSSGITWLSASHDPARASLGRPLLVHARFTPAKLALGTLALLAGIAAINISIDDPSGPLPPTATQAPSGADPSSESPPTSHPRAVDSAESAPQRAGSEHASSPSAASTWGDPDAAARIGFVPPAASSNIASSVTAPHDPPQGPPVTQDSMPPASDTAPAAPGPTPSAPDPAPQPIGPPPSDAPDSVTSLFTVEPLTQQDWPIAPMTTGTAEPGSLVSAAFSDGTLSTTADESGEWQLDLAELGLPAGDQHILFSQSADSTTHALSMTLLTPTPTLSNISATTDDSGETTYAFSVDAVGEPSLGLCLATPDGQSLSIMQFKADGHASVPNVVGWPYPSVNFEYCSAGRRGAPFPYHF